MLVGPACCPAARRQQAKASFELLYAACSKERKLLKSGKFPAEYSLPVDRKKINWEVMKQWITKRVTELLGIEDEILVLFIIEECQNSQV